MNLLLDTQIVIWWRTRDPRLSQAAMAAITNAGSVFVSAVSVIEAAIKISLGKLKLPEPFSVGVDQSGFSRLPVTFEHGERLRVLPMHHRDPFDRLLIAQALEEGLTLLTSDGALKRYRVPIVLAK